MAGFHVLVAALLFAACAATAGPTPLLPDFNCKKIAFYKTHKTGSTTLGGIMFRVAVANNMSLYTTKSSHYITVGYRETKHLLGRSDMVLRHIRYSASPRWHLATRSFYSRALGTSHYGFLTVLRHPVDRYISDFYYFTEPEARAAGRPSSLAAHVAAAEGANRMAAELGLAAEGEAAALAAAAGEMQADGLLLPVELLDYGLALLGSHCGWAARQLLYLAVNSNSQGAERYGKVTLAARPDMEELAATEPELLERIARLNSVDAVLYGAAQGLMLGRLAVGGAAAAAGVMGAAVRLTAARKRLEAKCRTLTAAPAAAEDVELAGLCAWYSLTDKVYERLPNYQTGYVTADTPVPYTPAAAGSPPPPSWLLVGDVMSAAERHLAADEDPSVPYYHSVLAVRVRPPTPAETDNLYGSGGGGDADAAADPHALLAAAVRLWTQHHGREGLHHLVLCVDGDMSAVQQDVVQHAATEALSYDAGLSGGSSSGGGGGAYTTFEVAPCGDELADAAGDYDSGGGSSGASAFLAGLAARSRWSAELPGLSYFLHGNRGTVRSALLSYEMQLPAAGSVCAPAVPWRVAGGAQRRRRLADQTTDDGNRSDVSSGDGGDSVSPSRDDGAACVQQPCRPDFSGSQLLRCVMLRSLPLLELNRTYSSNGHQLPYGTTKVSYKMTSSSSSSSASSSSYSGFEEHRLQVTRLLAASGEGEQAEAEADEEEAEAGAEQEEGGERRMLSRSRRRRLHLASADCPPLVRPRLQVPWCK